MIGLEMDNYWFSAKCYTLLLTELPQASFLDVTNLINWIRTVKSQKEIEYMRQAARICEKAMQRAIDNIEAERWEKDAAAKVVEAQIAGTDDYGGDSPAIFPIMPSAERTSTASSYLRSGQEISERRRGATGDCRCTLSLSRTSVPYRIFRKTTCRS